MTFWRQLVIVSLLFAALALPAGPTQSAPARAPGQSAFGVNSHIGSRYPDPSNMGNPAEALAQAQTGWAREDFQFSRISPQPGVFDWLFADAAVDQLVARGINIIGVLNGPTPAWASPGHPDPSFYPPDVDAFATFTREVLRRYKDRIKHWEIWNEPDNARYWQPAPDAGAYAALLKSTALAIREIDPQANILSAGLVTPEPAVSFLSELANNGAWSFFDIVSIHPYTDPQGPEEGQIDTAGVGQVKTLVDRLGTKPLWATEFGWSTGPGGRGGVAFDQETQASYLVRGAVLLRAAGVERVIWYNLKDDTGSENYGLLSFGGSATDYASLKPSYVAYKTLNEQLGDTTPAGLLRLGQQQTILDFEQFGTWRRGDQPNGEFTQSSAQSHSGSFSAQLRYTFPTGNNDYVVFTAGSQPTINPGSTQLGVWLFGDGSGHALKVWLRDAEGEVLQYRLGFVGGGGWQFLSASILGKVESYNRVSGAGNLQLDLPARLQSIVLDDEPDSAAGAGTIYLDDLIAASGPDAYGVRMTRAGGVVDVLWAPAGGQVSIPSSSAQATLVDRWGTPQTLNASNGQLTVGLGPSPVYLVHAGGTGAIPPPQPTPPPSGTADERCFPETGFCMAGRIRQFWEQNGGLPVFGYPITSQREEFIEGQPYQVQWFERNRLELHPENGAPYDVLLGRLGADRLTQQDRPWEQFPKGQPQSGCLFFEQTGHSVCGAILNAWRANGLELDLRSGKTESENLALWGLPLSEPQVETLSDGRQYTVQWFERARFELHPENQPPYDVLLGLLGNETLTQ